MRSKKLAAREAREGLYPRRTQKNILFNEIKLYQVALAMVHGIYELSRERKAIKLKYILRARKSQKAFFLFFNSRIILINNENRKLYVYVGEGLL